jgi:hypothetical protein
MVSIGTKENTNEVVKLTDTTRTSGVYVLGKSGFGKSVLLSSMAIQDSINGHGLFFLDPHGDAIAEMIPKLPHPPIILDVEQKTHSFGINLLSCRDVTDITERAHTYTRAYNVFRKIFQDEKGEWGPWLQLVIQYSLYVFIENQGYTLAELPLFLTDKTFREHLLRNVKHHTEAVAFWRQEFDPIQAQAALTRVRSLLGDMYVSHIIGQETTIDLAAIMEERRVVMLKLSSNLPEDVKKFIGVILLSELLHAVRNRPEGKRHQFSIFVDEMHNFVSSEDISTLITEGRKFGICFCGAHVERYGQLADNRKIAGATLATVNKVFFQLSVADAQEVAAEFADKPPVEYREERELVICRDPFRELLQRGHKNRRIQELADRYLEPINLTFTNLAETIETIRLERIGFQDSATLARDDASLSGIDERFASRGQSRDNLARNTALGGMQGSLGQALQFHGLAHGKTLELKEMADRVSYYKCLIGDVNKFFVGIMEGRVAVGKDKIAMMWFFKDILNCRYLPEQIKLVYLYLELVYGDSYTQFSYPACLAIRYRQKELRTHYLKQYIVMVRKIEEELAEEDGTPSLMTESDYREKLQKEAYVYDNGDIYSDNYRTYLITPPFRKRIYFTQAKNVWREEKVRDEHRIPDMPLRITIDAEKQTVINECKEELVRREGQRLFMELEEIIELCNLLSQPENHIKVQSGQYTQTPRHTRTTQDMTGEMVQELVSLPRYTAFSKIHGGAGMETNRIQTQDFREWKSYNRDRSAPTPYLKPRREIVVEMQRRQTEWRRPSNPPQPEPSKTDGPHAPFR